MERQKPEGIGKPDIEIIGKGNIGEKAKQLVEKTSILKQIGFQVPRRTVLAQDFFDGFFQTNGLGKSLTEANPTSDLRARIKEGIFSLNDCNALQGIFDLHGSAPLVLRSSAQGDARGTGVYKSEFSENKPDGARGSLKKVLASYFSEDAIAFRKDAKTGEGFGIIVEPLIGQELDGYFGPVLSGFGYTSTSSGEGYVNIVPGIGGGVDTRNGERITRSLLMPFEGKLYHYRINQRMEMYSGAIPLRRSAFLGTDSNGIDFNDYSSIMYMPASIYRKAEIVKASINLYESDRDKFRYLNDLNLFSFFDKIDKMEKIFERPQYFEWAMTIEDELPRYWITQIADADKKLDLMDFEKYGEPMLDGHTVTGTGLANCSKLVYCPDRYSIESLQQFNSENKNYFVIYSSRCTTLRRVDGLNYSDINNASVLMEDQEDVHAFDQVNPLGHLQGRLDMTGKLFGVINGTENINQNWLFFLKKGKKYDSSDLFVFEGKFTIVSSERQNRIVVYLQE